MLHQAIGLSRRELYNLATVDTRAAYDAFPHLLGTAAFAAHHEGHQLIWLFYIDGTKEDGGTERDFFKLTLGKPIEEWRGHSGVVDTQNVVFAKFGRSMHALISCFSPYR